MRVFFLSLTIILFTIFSTQGQSSLNFTAEDTHYRNALELLNQGKYLSAGKAFENYLDQGKDPLKLADAQYYIAFCALQLKNQDGEALIEEAKIIAREAGQETLLVMSGVGVREYYRKLGFERVGPYMGIRLD